MAHTPGPWQWSDRNWRNEADTHNRYITGDHREDEEGDSSVGIAIVLGNATSGDIQDANARLIAAAPELLATCEGCLALLEITRQAEIAVFGDGRRNETLETALSDLRAVITKAKGVSP